MSHTADLSDHVIAELVAENRLLRQMLWVWHGCPLGVHYGDDGELQCQGLPGGHPYIDFKRDTAQRIENALQVPSLSRIQLHQDDVCRHCGATRWSWDAGSKPCPSGAHEWITPN